MYILKSLAQIIGLETMHLGNPTNGQISVQDILTFCAGGYIAQNHLASSAENMQLLEQFKPKMVLHLRDPRQALLSWVYHVDWKSITEPGSLKMPPGYFEHSMSSKIDFQIEKYLPNLVSWVERWVEIAGQGRLPILITSQYELRRNEKAFFNAILSFYQIELDFTPPNLPRTLEETHFRKADPEEWKRTFTPEQAARATSAIPHALMRRFGWSDEG
ncbi:MAG TPA: hypothetical protein VIJ04_08920 [Xanthobacteraceae bacterium]